MKISYRSQQALAALFDLAIHDNQAPLSTSVIANHFGFSRLYLEQALSLLKKADLVTSVKGAHGGYRLSRDPKHITIAEVLKTVEPALFESGKPVFHDSAMPLNDVLNDLIIRPLDQAIQKTLEAITVQNILDSYQEHQQTGLMFYI
jgi:Rrf2 family transcriptional regulator, cysteine metabolism repressor